jgi:hypothetical protein
VAVIKLIINIKGIIILDMKIAAVISIISLIRLVEGGAAMLVITAVNHIIVMAGVKWDSPLFNNILRVLDDSYNILTRANIDDEVNPWATIKVNAEFHPHVELDIIPIIINPICPTDE